MTDRSYGMLAEPPAGEVTSVIALAPFAEAAVGRLRAAHDWSAARGGPCTHHAARPVPRPERDHPSHGGRSAPRLCRAGADSRRARRAAAPRVRCLLDPRGGRAPHRPDERPARRLAAGAGERPSPPHGRSPMRCAPVRASCSTSRAAAAAPRRDQRSQAGRATQGSIGANGRAVSRSAADQHRRRLVFPLAHALHAPRGQRQRPRLRASWLNSRAISPGSVLCRSSEICSSRRTDSRWTAS